MTPLGKASTEIVEIITKYREKLDEKYLEVDLSDNEQGVFLTCLMENNEKITLRAIFDYKRTKFTAPTNAKERIDQGGHQGVIKKMQTTNPNAWKIEVKQTIGNKIMEIGFRGSETNWDKTDFERDLVHTFVTL